METKHDRHSRKHTRNQHFAKYFTDTFCNFTSDASSYYEFDDFSLDFENEVLGSFGFIFQDFNQNLKSKRDQFKRVLDSKTRDGRKRLKRKLRNANTVLLRDKIAFLIGALKFYSLLFPSSFDF